jgi:hypothetical protein
MVPVTRTAGKEETREGGETGKRRTRSRRGRREKRSLTMDRDWGRNCC